LNDSNHGLIRPHYVSARLAVGYERLAEGAYYDEQNGLLIFDLFPRNAVQSTDGHIYPIDPVIQRITADFGQFPPTPRNHQPGALTRAG
jgi:hypothetical protein